MTKTSNSGRSATTCLAISMLALGALAGCNKSTPPQPEVPSSTTTTPSTMPSTPSSTGTTMPDSSASSPGMSASSAMPSASAASQ